MKIVASHCFGHDGSICLLEDGEISYWNKEERLSKRKRDRVPWLTMRELEDNFDLSDVDAFVSTRPPRIVLEDQTKNADLLNIHYIDYIWDYVGRVYRNWNRLYIPSHHLCHAANVFYASGFDSAYVLVSDGAGSFYANGRGIEVETIYYCEYPDRFELVYRTPDQWIGVTTAYSAITCFLGIHPMNTGKTMGLSTYGKENPSIPNIFEDLNATFPGNKVPMNGVTSYEDLTFFPWYTEFGECRKQLAEHLQCKPLDAMSQLVALPEHSDEFQLRADIAYMGQRGSSDALLNLLKEKVDFSRSSNLCFSGGHAHNCLLNYEIASAYPDVDFYPDPIASDEGLSIGAAKLIWYSNTKSMEKHPLDNIYGCGL